ncbi:hypothetical protein ES703_68943 [subsurface metagenome]
MEQQQLPQDCPVREILKQLSSVLSLLMKIIDHCERCLSSKQGKQDRP